MKYLGWIRGRHLPRAARRLFLLTPYLSTKSLKHPVVGNKNIFSHLVLYSFLTLGSLVLARIYLVPLTPLEVILISPFIYFFTETLGALGQLIFFKFPTVPIHRTPLRSQSLSEFWGRHWNIWIQDWLRDVSGSIGLKQKRHRIIIVFFLSGAFHELMINFPYWLVFGKSYFGTMMAYFLIQAMALWGDKKVMTLAPPLVRRIYLWAAVVLPSPLFLNRPLLTFFGLIYE